MTNREKLTMDYQSSIRTNEQEMDEIKKKKKTLDEKRERLHEFKRREMAFYNQLLSEYPKDTLKDTKRSIEDLYYETQHLCRKQEQGYEQEAEEIERHRKKLSAQKESLEWDYRLAMQR